ncbi:MAG: prevent-host-death family protein [Chloroflexi bacterium]|nr:prevent-host-death family protein [Chloroflexota bacterium]
MGDDMSENEKKDRLIRYVHAAEADDKLLELLKCVENGETIIITRQGKKVAHLTPPNDELERKLRKEAWDEIERRRATWQKTGKTMTTQEILDLRHEGHRF